MKNFKEIVWRKIKLRLGWEIYVVNNVYKMYTISKQVNWNKIKWLKKNTINNTEAGEIINDICNMYRKNKMQWLQ